MLNVFTQKIKLYLTSYSVHGDKTNEPGCLKQHPEELFSMYPTIQILTGDAIFAQRPLLEAIREYNRDYLFQVKDNQGRVFEQLKLLFDDAKKREPDNRATSKKSCVEIRSLWLSYRAADIIREQFEIPDCPHLAKDKFYGEDKHAFRVPGMGEVWTAMTGIATALVQLMYKGERTLKEIRERGCAYRHEFLCVLSTKRKLYRTRR